MNDEQADAQPASWQQRLANLRGSTTIKAAISSEYAGDLSQEALMTIIAIMKDNEDPKLQMAAAKMLLDKNVKLPAIAKGNLMPVKDDSAGHDSDNADITNMDVESAIALAKEILDALAERKAQKLDSKSEVVADGAARANNSEG